MHILHQAKRGDKNPGQVLFSSRKPLKTPHYLTQVVGIFFAQGKNLVVKFDLKQVDRLVIAFENEVDL